MRVPTMLVPLPPTRWAPRASYTLTRTPNSSISGTATVAVPENSTWHGIAVDPRTGNVWIGDREQYRLVVYTADGKHVKTVQMKTLTCAVSFDPQGNLWVATGHDGQVLNVDQDGNVLGAVGNGSGLGAGQFVEKVLHRMGQIV